MVNLNILTKAEKGKLKVKHNVLENFRGAGVHGNGGGAKLQCTALAYTYRLEGPRGRGLGKILVQENWHCLATISSLLLVNRESASAQSQWQKAI